MVFLHLEIWQQGLSDHLHNAPLLRYASSSNVAYLTSVLKLKIYSLHKNSRTHHCLQNGLDRLEVHEVAFDYTSKLSNYDMCDFSNKIYILVWAVAFDTLIKDGTLE